MNNSIPTQESIKLEIAKILQEKEDAKIKAEVLTYCICYNFFEKYEAVGLKLSFEAHWDMSKSHSTSKSPCINRRYFYSIFCQDLLGKKEVFKIKNTNLNHQDLSNYSSDGHPTYYSVLRDKDKNSLVLAQEAFDFLKTLEIVHENVRVPSDPENDLSQSYALDLKADKLDECFRKKLGPEMFLKVKSVIEKDFLHDQLPQAKSTQKQTSFKL